MRVLLAFTSSGDSARACLRYSWTNRLRCFLKFSNESAVRLPEDGKRRRRNSSITRVPWDSAARHRIRNPMIRSLNYLLGMDLGVGTFLAYKPAYKRSGRIVLILSARTTDISELILPAGPSGRVRTKVLGPPRGTLLIFGQLM